MKKTRLLTSLTALALVLSLGACSEVITEDDKLEEDDNEETTTEEETIPQTDENEPEDSSLTEEEIIDLILEEINTLSQNGLSWTSFHTEIESSEKTSIYLTTDSNSYAYGSLTTYEGEEVKSVTYIYEQEQFIKEGEEYKIETSSIEYESSLEEYVGSIIQEIAQSTLGAIQLTNDGSIYTLTDSVYRVTCLRSGDKFSISGVGKTTSEESLYTESISYDDVKETMESFQLYLWRDPKNPKELIDKAYWCANYTATIEYEKYTGLNTVTNAEYEQNPDGCYSTLTSEVELTSQNQYKVYYMEDCILAEEYKKDDDGEYVLSLKEIIINDEEEELIWDYYTYNNNTWYWDYEGNGGDWRAHYFSLWDAYMDGVGDYFILESSDVDYDHYTIEDIDAKASWFSSLGADWEFSGSGASLWGRTKYSLGDTLFSKNNQTLKTSYYCANLNYSDYWVNDDSTITFTYETFTSEISEVGNTDKSEECYAIHEIMQEQVSSSWWW